MISGPYNIAQKIISDSKFKGIIPEVVIQKSDIEVPTFEKMINDSAKLKYLDGLLYKLKRGGHRVLIFCQMTRMMNILEEYLSRMHYSYFRLDGNSNISERNQMVQEFQENDNIFAFILSTRAGGLGVTLTAADTVIFYDNDWNPTMDAQATDRAHRIGQSKDVSVYRLITKKTVEERIVRRALQKQTVQQTVYAGEALKADVFKPQEVLDLLFDEGELDLNTTSKFISRGAKKKVPVNGNTRRIAKDKNGIDNELGDGDEDGGMDIEGEADDDDLEMDFNDEDDKDSDNDE